MLHPPPVAFQGLHLHSGLIFLFVLYSSSTININAGTGKQASLIASKPCCCVANVCGECESAQGNSAHHFAAAFRCVFTSKKERHPKHNVRIMSEAHCGQQSVSHVCLASDRMDDVEADVVLRPFKCETLAGIGDSCFRCSVPD